MARRTTYLGGVVLLCATTSCATGPGPERPEPVQVAGADVVSPTRLVLEYYPTIRECGGGRMLAPEVQESADDVRIHLTQVVRAESTECQASAEIGEITVELTRPLAGQEIRDGLTGGNVGPQPWSPFRDGP